MRRAFALAVLLLALGAGLAQAALPVYQEPPFFEKQVKKGELQPVAERLPADPMVAAFDWPGQVPGQYGGELTMMMSSV